MQDLDTTTGDSRPLLGSRIMVTRPADVPDPLAERLRALGADVIVQPAIRIAPPADWKPVDKVLDRLHDFDWIVFSSANGVRYFFQRWLERRLAYSPTTPFRAADKPLLHPADKPLAVSHAPQEVVPTPSQFPRVAAIGPGTADELARYGQRPDLVPGQFRAEALADALAADAAGKRFLLARASRGRDVLAEQLTAAGATVEQVVVYTSSDATEADPDVAALLRAGKIDWITVTSSAIARSLARLFGDDLRRAKLASISPLTSSVLRELGYQPAAEAVEYTLAGLTAAIAGHQ
jgi:uroporphyrinogen III methyltransferase / synthase